MLLQLQSKRGFDRRHMTWFMLLVFVVALLPIPALPINHQSADENLPYPCQGGTCGCKSAEQCWKSCCCLSAAERIAWAKKRNISLPKSLLASVQLASIAEEVPESTCQENSPPAKRTCCEDTEKITKPSSAKSCCKQVLRNVLKLVTSSLSTP